MANDVIKSVKIIKGVDLVSNSEYTADDIERFLEDAQVHLPKATEQMARDGTDDSSVMTPWTTKSQLTEEMDEANIQIPKASVMDVQSGTSDSVVVTPYTSRKSIEAHALSCDKHVDGSTYVRYSKTDKIKLAGLSGYLHPSSHPASMIDEDASRQFVTSQQKHNILSDDQLAGLVTTAERAQWNRVKVIAHCHLGYHNNQLAKTNSWGFTSTVYQDAGQPMWQLYLSSPCDLNKVHVYMTLRKGLLGSAGIIFSAAMTTPTTLQIWGRKPDGSGADHFDAYLKVEELV